MTDEDFKKEKQKLDEKYQKAIEYLDEIKQDLKEKLGDDRLEHFKFDYDKQIKDPKTVVLTFLEIDTEIVYEDKEYNYAEMEIKAIMKEMVLLNEFLSYLDRYTEELKEEKQYLLYKI